MKRSHMGVSFEQRPHDVALDTHTTSMNDAHNVNAMAKAFADIFFDNTRNILRREWVQVDRVLDGNDDRPVEGGIFRIGPGHQC